MDVTCERCSTAYEFDDALVSERGTTVKCTNCGHQFKVRRPQPLGAPERWLVRTIDGRELEFRALRELQAAIAQAVITRDDVLSRGGSRPRRLGSIAELEPFFVSAGSSGPSHATSLGLGPRAPIITGAGYDGVPPAAASRPSAPTPLGIGLMPPPRSSEVSIAIPLPRGPEAATPPPPARRPASVPPPPRRSTPTPQVPAALAPLPGVIVGPGGAPPIHPVINEDALYDDTTRALRPPADDVSAPTAPFHTGAALDPVKVRALIHEDWSSPAAGPLPNGGARGPSTMGPQAAPNPGLLRSPESAHAADPSAAPSSPGDEGPAQNQETASVPPLTPTPGMVRNSYPDDLAEPRFSQAASRRSGAARWIVALVLVGMMALAFVTIGRKMLVTGSPAKAGEPDARIGVLLAEGEKNLADGDLESAKEQLDKASVLVERDPRTAADLARLAAAKADVDWLRVRLLATNDPEQATARRELEQSAQRAQKAADLAAAIAPADPAVVRSRIDALRLAGDLAGARRLVGGISGASAQPSNALTLAELDLAEAKPDWPTVLGRLRAALSSDGNLGRARAMLVYALARSGDAAASRAELERLRALSRPHPLLGTLGVYVSHASSAVDPNALPDASAKPSGAKPALAAPAAREPRELHDRPVPAEPRAPSPPPEEHVAPSGPIDTSDLPGVKAPSSPPPPPPSPALPPPTAAPAPPPTSTVPPGVDTSDLPGFK
jgi:predicted Zn finger-like uncharacterized protein